MTKKQERVFMIMRQTVHVPRTTQLVHLAQLVHLTHQHRDKQQVIYPSVCCFPIFNQPQPSKTYYLTRFLPKTV